MAEVESQKDIGFRGLDLGTNPGKTRNLSIADGARLEIGGELTPRLGRVAVGLSYPYEGFGDDTDVSVGGDYVETISNFQPGSTLGIEGFYDQRIEVEVPETLSDTNFRREDGNGWAGTGPWVFQFTSPQDDAYALYFDLAGFPDAGNLTQFSADFNKPAKPDTDYVLKYHITRNTGSGGTANTTMTLTTSFSATTVTLSTESGYHEYPIRSALAPGDFVINVANTNTSIFQINSISLKEKRAASVDRVPQRLALIYKTKSEIHFNYDNGSAYIIAAGSENVMESDRTRAKIVVHGTDVLVADESSEPRYLRRRPSAEQDYLKRVVYEWKRLGIRWPTPSTPVPRLVTFNASGVSSIDMEGGLYRFRVALQDRWGHMSNPSLPASIVIADKPNNIKSIGIDWSHMRSEWEKFFPAGELARINVYFQYEKTATAQETPSAYRLFDQVLEDYQHPVDGAVTEGVGSTRMFESTRVRQPNSPLMYQDNGHPPRLKDIIVVDSTAYGIAMPDVIFRETLLGSGEGNPVINAPRPFYGPQLEDNSRITPKRVDSSYFFVGKPNLPGSMQNWIRLGRGAEIGVGLAEMGSRVIVFTNQAIYSHDPTPTAISPIGTLTRLYSKVGCAARDSIRETERGIRFMGTDGVPRLFNGATVEEIANEVQPVFHKDDYSGYYMSYDGRFPEFVTSGYGRGRYYLNYPVSAVPGLHPTIENEQDEPADYDMAIAEETEERPRWAIDAKRKVREVLWLGREARLLGIEGTRAYWLDEGLSDATYTHVAGFEVPTVVPVPFTFGFRWYAAASGLEGQFYRFRIDADTKGNNLTVSLTVDGEQSLTETFTLNTAKRDALDTNLPARFKGRYLDVRITGTYLNARPIIYDHFVEAAQRGEF